MIYYTQVEGTIVMALVRCRTAGTLLLLLLYRRLNLLLLRMTSWSLLLCRTLFVPELKSSNILGL